MAFWMLLVVLLATTAAATVMERPFYEANAKLSVEGHLIWGGDMVITDDQFASLIQDLEPRTARKDPKSRWPNGYIPFKISPELEVARSRIYEAFQIWNNGTCIYFYEDANISPKVPHLVLKKTGTGCNSWVGIYNTTSKEQIVSLDEGCHTSIPVILHELGHALGLWHEQDRPDRDNYLTIHTDNMDPGNRIYFNNPVWDVDTYGTPYDYTSIMQYSVDAFSGNGKMTLVPKDPLGEVVMSHAKRPSFRDFHLVNLMYKCTDYCLESPCSNGGYRAWNYYKGCRCICPSGFGGDSCNINVPTEPSCLYTITSPTTIRTPNYPSLMPVGKRCGWLIKAPNNKMIQVTFNTFQMLGRYSETNTCVWDYLRVRKADLQSDNPGELYCGEELKGQSLFSAQEMLLLLSTNTQSEYYNGFEAFVTFL